MVATLFFVALLHNFELQRIRREEGVYEQYTSTSAESFVAEIMRGEQEREFCNHLYIKKPPSRVQWGVDAKNGNRGAR